MKRKLLGVVTVVALVVGGMLTATAKADHGHGRYRPGPRVAFYGSYGSFYQPYQPYCRPCTPCCPPAYVPYGAGYIGGYQPYSQFYARPRVGLYFNF